MNAFTSADYTMYPIATTNRKDFRNLMTMYLDSTLHPLLKRSDFLQEAWRVGPENPLAAANASDGNLVFKGVVYNEMKGQFSDATYLYYMRWLQEIFPSLNFYGGDPREITDLTYEHLRQFHKAHYHPSNSKVLTYGDTPVQDHLAILGPELDRFAAVDADLDLKMPESLADGPRDVVVHGPMDLMLPPDSQNKTSVTWLMGDSRDIQESFALRIATTLLLDGYGSPMYRALVESGLGTDYTPNTGYDTSSAKAIFSLGLNGVSDGNLPKIRDTIMQTLRDVVEKGFEDQKVRGLLQQLELGLKHKTATFGLDLINRLKPGWFNGIDPFDALAWNSVVETFKSAYEEKGYLEGLLRKYLLNDRTLTFTMRPSPTYAAELTGDESQRLRSKIDESVKQHGSEEAAQRHLRQQELALLEEQEAGRHQSLDCLPTLRVSDIPRRQEKIDVRDAVVQQQSGNEVKVQWRETHTNGLTYFRALAPFQGIEPLRPLLPLFCDCLTRLGTRNKSMEELEDLIKLKTGGISFAYHTSTSPTDLNRAEEGLVIAGYALDGEMKAMYELISTLLLETDFDSPNAKMMIKQLLQSGASGAIDAVAESGHAYARRYAEAGLSRQSTMVEQTAGMTQVESITRLATIEENSTAMDALVEKLKLIQNLAAAQIRSSSRVALTCGADVATANEKELQDFLHTFTSVSVSPTSPDIARLHDDRAKAPHMGKTFFNLPFQVYYSGLAVPTFPYSDPRGAPMAVLAQLLTHKHLHHEIREKGGAYGAGAYSRGLGGLWGMYSYRDPNPENTLRTMYDAGRWARDRTWTDTELEEAKLSLFQGIDAPQSVSDEGMVKFLSGVDQDMEQRRRELLLDVSKEQVRQAADWVSGRLDAGKENLVLLGEKKGFVGQGWNIEDMGAAIARGPSA